MKDRVILSDMQSTYNYIWNRYMSSRRLILPRYGDGEYLIMKGSKKIIASHTVTEELTNLMNKAIKVKRQLVCIPMKGVWDNKTHPDVENIRTKASDYFVNVGDQPIYGHVQWRMVDVHHNYNLLAEFFIGKTLVVTGNHVECKKAFELNNIDIDILAGGKTNAFSDYKALKESLTSTAKIYDNIIFALGPTSNILIADLVGICRSNLVDIGGFLGMLINPYSDDESLVKKWTGIPMRTSKEMIRRHSKTFFKKLNDKIKLYGGE